MPPAESIPAAGNWAPEDPGAFARPGTTPGLSPATPIPHRTAPSGRPAAASAGTVRHVV